MSIEDGDNLRFNAAIMLCEAAEVELAAAKTRKELAELKLSDYKAGIDRRVDLLAPAERKPEDLHTDKRFGTQGGKYVFFHPGGVMFAGQGNRPEGWYFWDVHWTCVNDKPCATEQEAKDAQLRSYRHC